MKVHELDVHPALPERIAWLDEIARNVWSAWSPEAGDLFARLDPEAWERLEHNPIALLRGLPQDRLDRLAADESFVAMVARVARRLDAYVNDPGWLVPANPDASDMLVAYFSLEFGLDAGIPLYSGGLGILAGDHLKSASDLGVPLVGRGPALPQRLLPPVARPRRRPARALPGHRLVGPAAHATRPAPTASRSWSRCAVGDETVRAAVRRIQVGRVPLLLLDADIDGNSPRAREITSVLYGGDRDQRMRQEVLLGIGGVRALAAAGMNPTVFHMNEGHSALLVLERMRALIAPEPACAGEAREQVVASTVFTTHTPVPAGNETFDPELARGYLEPLAVEAGMTWDDLVALAAHPDEAETDFGMTPLALRTSGFANGVAALHGDTSRHMWRGLWPELPHRRGPDHQHHQRHPHAELAQPRDARAARPLHRPRPAGAPRGPDRLGAGRHDPGRRAVAGARAAPRAPGAVRPRAPRRSSSPARARAASPARAAGDALRPDALTICFARRFATYKRADLLFRDPDRLARLLERREAAGADDRGRQGAPARRPGQGGAAHRRPGVAAPAPARPDRVPRGLRHARGALPGAGRRRLAQRAAPAARGLGHQRHEGRRQRRPQPVGARRLVGRGLLAGLRLGDRHAARPTRTRRRTTPSRPRPSTRCSSARSSRPSTPATPPAARASGRR